MKKRYKIYTFIDEEIVLVRFIPSFSSKSEAEVYIQENEEKFNTGIYIILEVFEKEYDFKLT